MGKEFLFENGWINFRHLRKVKLPEFSSLWIKEYSLNGYILEINETKRLGGKR